MAMTEHERHKRRGLIVRRVRARHERMGLVEPERHRARGADANDETTEAAGWDDLLETLPDAD